MSGNFYFDSTCRHRLILAKVLSAIYQIKHIIYIGRVNFRNSTKQFIGWIQAGREILLLHHILKQLRLKIPSTLREQI